MHWCRRHRRSAMECSVPFLSRKRRDQLRLKVKANEVAWPTLRPSAPVLWKCIAAATLPVSRICYRHVSWWVAQSSNVTANYSGCLVIFQSLTLCLSLLCTFVWCSHSFASRSCFVLDWSGLVWLRLHLIQVEISLDLESAAPFFSDLFPGTSQEQWVSADGYFGVTPQEVSSGTSRASIAKLRSQNLGMVRAKAR